MTTKTIKQTIERYDSDGKLIEKTITTTETFDGIDYKSIPIPDGYRLPATFIGVKSNSPTVL